MLRLVFSWLLLWMCTASAQTIMGSIVGSVADPGGLPVAGAEIKVTQTSTGTQRTVRTDNRGDFLASGLNPDRYTVLVTVTGFKTLERREVALSAGERLALGELKLELGSVAESISVEAQGTAVQTASAERSGVVTQQQIDNLMIRGRNVMALLQILPGVLDNDTTEDLSLNWNVNINGNRNNTTNLSLDGLSVNNIGNQNASLVTMSADSIAEVQVLLSNYQAQYGLMSGATVVMVAKSGTRSFHGLGSYFKRHEQFNATPFFNNRLGLAKPRSRYNTWTYNVGGPIYVPGRFNRNRDKLFFFWNQEFWPALAALPVTNVTVPTAAERDGDFSQSLDQNARLFTVSDPLNNRQPFPGNVVPSSRFDPSGRSLLKMQPLPNFFNQTIARYQYNRVFQAERRSPKEVDTLKLDYNIGPNDVLSFTSAHSSMVQEGSLGLDTSGGTNIPLMDRTYSNKTRTYQVRYQRIIRPDLINELNTGHIRLRAVDTFTPEELAKVQRKTVGYTAGQLFAGVNPLDIIPATTFGVTNGATLGVADRFPYAAVQYRYNLSDNLTKVVGKHTLKAGLFFDRVWSNRAVATNYYGTLAFSNNSTNPLNTGYGYAGALLGYFNNYSEGSAQRGYLHYRVNNVEWYVQDNWKVSRRLTLDYGMRFYVIQPLYERDNLLSGFVPARYNASKPMQLVVPRMVNGARVGVDPVTGVSYPNNYIGAIAPSSEGSLYNGMVTGRDPSYPRTLYESRGLQYGPRVGFAYDPFGKGNTALRGGFGVFYNRQNLDNSATTFALQSPLVLNPTTYFGRLSELQSSRGVYFPQTVYGIDRTGKVPMVMNYSIGVQRKLIYGTVLDVGYVGSLGRHLMWTRELNAIPLGANFNPANFDPTLTRTVLTTAFLRPTSGYQSIFQREWGSSSNYHSMQTTVTRRYGRGLQAGAAWTWSKTMGFNDTDASAAVSALVPVRVWDYSLLAYDRTHILKVNWLWDAPRFWKGWRPVGFLLNSWQVSGIASFVSGAPAAVGYTLVSGTDITGTTSQSARIVVTDDARLPKGDRRFARNFRTDVFRPPAVGTIGNAAKYFLRGPGIDNWDISLLKNFPIYESMRAQFRMEMYNAFNHTQFSSMDTTARFDAAGNQINTTLSQFTAARNPRTIQMSLRLYF
jgi:hypothetical protein